MAYRIRTTVTRWLPVLAAAAFSAACVAEAGDPEPQDAPDARPIGDRPPDAEPRPDAEVSEPDAGPDKEPECALPLTILIDENDDMASFFYSDPACSGESGFDVDAALVFEDEYDSYKTFSAYAATNQWQIQEIDYSDLTCIMDDATLACQSEDAGELIPVRLSGSRDLDLEFRFDHDEREVTIESVSSSD